MVVRVEKQLLIEEVNVSTTACNETRHTYVAGRYWRIHRLSDHLNHLKGVSQELLAALLLLYASWLFHPLSSARDKRPDVTGQT